MAAPASIGATYKVPDWAVKNKEIFLSAARGGVPPPAEKERSPLHMSLMTMEQQSNKAAVSMAVLSEETSNGIQPPTGSPAADYFKDVANHPDVLSTIISTARSNVGFLPDVNGTNLTIAQLLLYIYKFNQFVDELKTYNAFIDLTDTSEQKIHIDGIDCNLIINTITSGLAEALGVTTSGPVFDALVESTSNLITIAINYVSGSGIATSATFEMVGLPKSNEVGDQDPYQDPISAVTFTTTTLYKKDDGKNNVQESNIIFFANTFQLKSSAVIECADQLAGCTITGTLALRDYINSTLLS